MYLKVIHKPCFLRAGHKCICLTFFYFNRAATNCDLFVLTKTNLDASLKYYPHIAEQIREVAGNRANLVKKRSQAAAKAAAEGKSASDAAKAAAQVNNIYMYGEIYPCGCLSCHH